MVGVAPAMNKHVLCIVFAILVAALLVWFFDQLLMERWQIWGEIRSKKNDQKTIQKAIERNMQVGIGFGWLLG